MPLNRRQIIQLANVMSERRNALLDEIRNDVARSREEPYASVAGATPDLGDQSVADLVADVDQAELTRDLAELRALDAAIRRVLDGSYGLCVDCGTEIPLERLRAQPSAARCIGCQEHREKTYRT
jgi:RNA polymerase-binding transcription factor DksA